MLLTLNSAVYIIQLTIGTYMTDTKVMKITERANRIDNFKSVTVFGDPGCDGLGAATMSIFAKALRAQRSDFSIIAGDIVHRGKQSLYDTV